ncbi:MAG: patatin family protein [Spirochaetaceae bacterium]|nr:patatin family protein [Spirochaetaceae bacterium]
MEKTSLVIEGGGMRGMYTAGVLDCLIQRNIYWNNTYGVSAGACHGLSYISKQFDRARRVNANYASKARYSGVYCLLKHGTYFGFDYIFKTIPKENPIDWFTFFKNQSVERKFIITVTNAETGKAEYIQPNSPEDALQWLQASSSLPIIGKPMHINGKIYFDGGISDSIPIMKAQQDGNTKHIIILTQPKDYKKKPVSSSMKKVLKRMYKKYPNFIEANLARPDLYNKTLNLINQLEEENKAFVFRPKEDVLVSRLCKDKERLNKLYQAGYEDCLSNIDCLLKFAPSATLAVK